MGDIELDCCGAVVRGLTTGAAPDCACLFLVVVGPAALEILSVLKMRREVTARLRASWLLLGEGTATAAASASSASLSLMSKAGGGRWLRMCWARLFARKIRMWVCGKQHHRRHGGQMGSDSLELAVVSERGSGPYLKEQDGPSTAGPGPANGLEEAPGVVLPPVLDGVGGTGLLEAVIHERTVVGQPSLDISVALPPPPPGDIPAPSTQSKNGA